MHKPPEIPGLEGFLSGGLSKVPGEITRRVGEAFGVCCALYVLDIDGTLLHPIASWSTPDWPDEGTGGTDGLPHPAPGPISLVDGEDTPQRVVFERRVVSATRQDWVGQTPLPEEHLAAAPVRAADATTGLLVVGGPEPLEEALISALWSVGFQAGAAMSLADGYSDVLVCARRRGSLSLPAEMQQDLLPPGEMHDPRVGVAGAIEPSYDIGGDWYDYALRDGKLYVAVGDPSGKGLSAEILAAVCFAATRNARREGEGLPGIMTAAHRAMREVSSPDQYCTLLMAEIDLSTYEAELLVAGHPPPLYIPAGGSGEDGPAVLPVSNLYPPVGALDEEEDYHTEHHQLRPGSRLLLFSDGITERGDGAERMMGVEGLARFARENQGLGVLAFVRGLLGTVRGYADKPITDDATVVLLDLDGGQAFGEPGFRDRNPARSTRG